MGHGANSDRVKALREAATEARSLREEVEARALRIITLKQMERESAPTGTERDDVRRVVTPILAALFDFLKEADLVISTRERLERRDEEDDWEE